MLKENCCEKCGSENQMFPLDVVGYGQSPIKLMIEQPKSLIGMNLPDLFPLQASVCSNCGHVELKVENPEKIFSRWQKSKE